MFKDQSIPKEGGNPKLLPHFVLKSSANTKMFSQCVCSNEMPDPSQAADSYYEWFQGLLMDSANSIQTFSVCFIFAHTLLGKLPSKSPILKLLHSKHT